MSDKWDEAVEIFSLGAEMSLNYHDEPIKVCYSGGKDSDVLLEVAKASGQPFILSYNVTTVDSPDTMRHIKEVFRREEQNGIECQFSQPTYKGKPTTMWKLIPIKKPPHPPYQILLRDTQGTRPQRESRGDWSALGGEQATLHPFPY